MKITALARMSIHIIVLAFLFAGVSLWSYHIGFESGRAEMVRHNTSQAYFEFNPIYPCSTNTADTLEIIIPASFEDTITHKYTRRWAGIRWRAVKHVP